MDKRPRFWFDVRRAQGPSAEFDTLIYTLLFYDIPGVLQGHRQNCTKNSKLRDKIQ
jgi:hypothetical protein